MRTPPSSRPMPTTEKEELLARAQSEAEALKGKGDAEAAKYFEVFAKNPDLAIYLRKIRALQETLKTQDDHHRGPEHPAVRSVLPGVLREHQCSRA